MRDVKTVGIISKPKVPHAAPVVTAILRWLEDRRIAVRCDTATAGYAGRTDGLPREQVADGADLLVVLGGDGTLLAAARAADGRNVPLFPVNLGGLGFLTAITRDEIGPELERFLRGEHRIGRRSKLRARVFRGDEQIAEYEALNDVVLTKSSIARMIDFDVYVDERFVAAYKADGLILCTPTGSTAYSLSAGGPIIFPQVSAVCLTPICPHMLTNRPVVVPDESTIEVINRSSDGDTYLTIDGQVGEPLRCGDRVIARRSPHVLQLVRPPRSMFFDVLRQKLKWGER